MNFKLIPLLAAGLLCASPAFSALVDFEGATSFSPVAGFYNTGGGGANFGLDFSPSATALSNDGLGSGPGGTYYSNAPSNGTVMFAPDIPAVMNSALGFNGPLSFYYSSKTLDGGDNTVKVYSGLDGTGIQLALFTLAANADADVVFDTWTQVSTNLGGDAHSIVFGNNGGFTAYDNISVNPVPLPAAALLFPFGAAGLGFIARRRKQA